MHKMSAAFLTDDAEIQLEFTYDTVLIYSRTIRSIRKNSSHKGIGYMYTSMSRSLFGYRVVEEIIRFIARPVQFQ